MKKSRILFLLAILALCFSCSKKTEDRKNLSSVRDANQETQVLIHSVDTWAKARDLAKTKPEEFVKYLYEINPNLDRDVIRELTNYQKITPGEKISLRYHYFSQEGKCDMQNKENKYTHVKFHDEIVIEVIRPGKETLWVALSCLNGMLKIDGKSAISADAAMDFVIAKGQGLSRYLADDYWAINVAETFNLPLYKGKNQVEKFRINPAQARAIIPNTGITQITVYTEPGWHFVLKGNNWTLNGLSPAQFRL